MRNHRQWTVIIAMIAVRMVQASIDEIIRMVPMWNRFMTTSGSMPMLRAVSAGTMLRAAAIRICFTHFDHVFIDTPVVRMLEMAMVEIIDVTLVANSGVAAARPVDVRMTGGNHDVSFPDC